MHYFARLRNEGEELWKLWNLTMNKIEIRGIRRIPIRDISLLPPMAVAMLLPNYGEGAFSSLFLIGVTITTILFYNSVVSHYGTQAHSQATSHPADNHWLIRSGLMLLACGIGWALLVSATYFFVVYLDGVLVNAL